MDDRIVEARRGPLLLTTDRAKIDVDGVLAMLLVSHWGGSLTRPMLERAIANSVCISVLDTADAANDNRQLGFARAVSDLATYAYLTDVIVAPEARGQGIGKWM